MKKLFIIILLITEYSCYSATLYWKNTSGSVQLWSDATRWFTDAACTSANGAAPSTGDIIYFNANGQGNCRLSAGVSMASINFTGYTSQFTQDASTTITITGTGGLTMSSSMTYTLGNSSSSAVIFTTNSCTLTMANKTFGNVSLNQATKTLTISGNGSISNLVATSGTIDMTGGTISMVGLSTTNSANSALNITNATLSIGATFTIYTASSITTTGSTINLTGTPTTATLGGKTYNVINFNRTTYTLAGGGCTIATTTFGGNAGTCTITGSNNFGTLTVGSDKTLNFTAGTTTTVTSIASTATPSNTATIQSATAGSQWTISDASGTNTVTSFKIKDSNATGGAIFKALASTNLGNNTGWIIPGASTFFIND